MRYVKLAESASISLSNDMTASQGGAIISSPSTTLDFYPAGNIVDPDRAKSWCMPWTDISDSARIVVSNGTTFSPEVVALIDCKATTGFFRLIGASTSDMVTDSIYYDIPFDSHLRSGVHLAYPDLPSWVVGDVAYQLLLDPSNLMSASRWEEQPTSTGNQGYWATYGDPAPVLSTINEMPCLSFSGVSTDAFTRQGGAVGDMTGGLMSVVCYLDSASTNGIYPLVSHGSDNVGVGSSSRASVFLYDSNTNKIVFRPTHWVSGAFGSSTSRVEVVASITLDTWHVVSWLWYGTNVYFYVDGVMVGSGSDATLDDGGRVFKSERLGRGQYTNLAYNWLAGKIACVRQINGTFDYASDYTTTMVKAVHSELLHNFGIQQQATERQFWAIYFQATLPSRVRKQAGNSSPALMGALGLTDNLSVGLLWLGDKEDFLAESKTQITYGQSKKMDRAYSGAIWTDHWKSPRTVKIQLPHLARGEVYPIFRGIYELRGKQVLVDLHGSSSLPAVRDSGLILGRVSTETSIALKLKTAYVNETSFEITESLS